MSDVSEIKEDVDMTTKLINVTHKPCRVFDSDVILTIHAGREIAEQKSKDGFLSVADMEWMKNNTISDATGENISSLNRYYNEMTAIYWAWKNYDKIGSPTSVGCMHYRRHFILKDKLKITGNYLNDLGLTEDNLESLTAQYDIIHPQFVNTGDKTFISLIGEEYCTLGGDKSREAIHLALEIIKEIHPTDYKKVYDVLYGNQTGSFCNMFIMKRNVFFEYCEWIFPILFELDKRLGRDYKEGQERCVGWTAEMLTSIFIYLKSQSCSHKEVFVFNQDKNAIKSPSTVFIQRCKLHFKKSKKYKANVMNYLLFNKYCK